MPTFVPRLDRARVVEATGHTHALWGGGRSREDHAAHTLAQLDLAGPDLLHYAGLVDDTGLVASMKRYGLRLRGPDGRELPAVGIGAVFTREDARGRGHAAALLREILGEAREAGASAAWLHAEIDPAYYARLGFLELPGSAYRASAADLPDREPLQIRPASPEDIERLLAWYDAAYPPGPWLRPARWPHMWRYFVFRNGVSTWIIADAGKDVGYLAASPGRGALWVNEWSAPGVDHARILATLRAFAGRENLTEVAGWLRPDQAGPPFRAEPRKAGVPMIALLDATWAASPIDPGRIHFGSFEYF
jgi:GNAT superfamily N-acetyltransferase